MTNEEAVEKLTELSEIYDPEFTHGRADDILIEVLKAYGATDVVDAYKAISSTFWYA